jgi:hypothetical protein
LSLPPNPVSIQFRVMLLPLMVPVADPWGVMVMVMLSPLTEPETVPGIKSRTARLMA